DRAEVQVLQRIFDIAVVERTGFWLGFTLSCFRSRGGFWLLVGFLTLENHGVLRKSCLALKGTYLELNPPVEPNPPVPRALSSSESASMNTACSTFWMTNWAMRSPRLTSKAADLSVFSKVTMIS